MYAFIEGKVCDKGPGTMVIEAGGVGYLLNCSMTTIQSAPPEGEKMRCQTWLSVKEDALELYGFATTEEKKLFLKLISVSGVGPKMALGLLGAMSVQDLNMAILMEDLVGNRERKARCAGGRKSCTGCSGRGHGSADGPGIFFLRSQRSALEGSYTVRSGRGTHSPCTACNGRGLR